MGITTGIEQIGDYSAPATNALKVGALKDLLPNPDLYSGGAGAVAVRATQGRTNTYLDEMAPMCAAQLLVELDALIDEVSPAPESDSGTYTVTAGDASGNEATVDTGIAAVAVFTTLIVSYQRSGVQVAGGTVTDNGDGTFTITETGGLDITENDTVDWYAAV